MYLILDLSNNNPPANWKTLREFGVDAVWLKASEGSSFVDSTYHERARGARAAGLRVGAYHFARPDTGGATLADARDEARHFCNVVRKIERRDLRPALDLEVGSPQRAYDAWSRTFNVTVQNLLGVMPVFYSYSSYIMGMRLREPIGAALWLANFGRNDGKEYPFTVPAPWKRKDLVAHQFTSMGRVPGIQARVDLSSCSKIRHLLAHPIAGLR